MHLKPSRPDLPDLFYFIFLIVVPLHIHIVIRKSPVFILLFDDFRL